MNNLKEEAKLKVKDDDLYELEEVEIFKSGTWNGDSYSEQDLEEIVDNFYDLPELDVPIKFGHDEEDIIKKSGLPSGGWVTELKKVGNRLLATFSGIPKKIFEILKRRSYKNRSIEIYPEIFDTERGKTFRNVLRAVAFLGQDFPAINSLADIEALYHSNNSESRVYFFKEGDFLMDQDKKKLEESKDEYGYPEVEKEKTKEKEEEEKKKEEEKEKREKDIFDELEKMVKILEELKSHLIELQGKTKSVGEGNEQEEKKGEEEEKIKMSEAKEEEVSETVNELEKKISELEERSKLDEIEKFTQKLKREGRYLPSFDEDVYVILKGTSASKENLKNFSESKLRKIMVEQEKKYQEHLKSLLQKIPKLVEFSELGKSDEEASLNGTREERLVERAKEIRKAEAVSFKEALLRAEKLVK